MDVVLIGRKISEQRKIIGMTQEELAEKVGVSPQAVSKWENGRNMPDIDNLLIVAETLKIPYAYLVEERDDEHGFDFRSRLFHEDNMYTRVKTISQTMQLKNTLAALVFMRDRHEGQLRRGSRYSSEKVKYINHPLMMACHAFAMGIYDDNIIAAILLHDVLEDTDTQYSELPVDDYVKDIVKTVTFSVLPGKTKEQSKADYYAAIMENRDACLVKMIDRCNNVSTMAGCFSREKMSEYVDETEQYIMPILKKIKNDYPEYSDAAFLVKYHIISIIECVKSLLAM